MTTVSLLLELGSSPAPQTLIEALRGVEVTRGDRAPDTFSLVFHTERDASDDYPLAKDPLLAPFQRVTLTTVVGSTSQILIDGYITGRQLAPGGAPQGTTLTVSGEDVSLKMNMIEISTDYPHMGDFAIAAFILAKYALFKILPDPQPTLSDVVPFDYVPQQNGTDRKYLLDLAEKHGYRFYIKPGPTKGWNKSYWGPPDFGAAPQKALTVDMGPATNVESIQFGENAIAPTITYGMVPQTLFEPPAPQEVPVGALASTRSPPLAADPVMGGYGDTILEVLADPMKLLDLDVRGSLFQTKNLGPNQDQSLGFAQAMFTAAGITNDSTDDVVTVQGKLGTTRYGAVLQAPGIVSVRGAGYSFDGLYYVKKVQHSISTVQGSWSYTQDFTLTREGTGSTIQEVTNV